MMLLKQFTILCVEDDASTRVLLDGLLTHKVKKLYMANNGVEGLELFKELNPDIVLTDIFMPKMNGIEMSKQIKQINPEQHIAIFTALNEVSSLNKAINIGVDKYIIKPISDLNIFYKTLGAIAKSIQNDIDRKQMESILQTQNRLTSINDIIGNIAHQWRQPLSIINAKASQVKLNIDLEKELTNEELNNCVNTVVSQTQFLSKTINNFRMFFNDTEDSDKKFNIKDTMRKLIDVSKDSFNINDIHIISNIIGYNIYQNESKLLQALINIFNNAKDAYNKNKIESKKYFFIDTKIEDNYLIISLKDSAGGIDKNDIDKIFEPYFTTKHKASNTGISLYMTNQIITKYFNGTIKATNQKFEYDGENLNGAEFIVKLPITVA